MSLVRPGDIILSRGTSCESSFIALLTAGCYSHAHLIVSDDYTLEATEAGTGRREIRRFTVASDAREYGEIPCSGNDRAAAAVFRLTSASDDPGSGRSNRDPWQAEDGEPTTGLHVDVSKIMSRLTEHGYGKEFSLAERLCGPLEFPPYIEWPLRRLLRTWDRDPKKWAPGFYCSELVTTAFKLQEIELFDESQPADRVSPNDLSRCSRLRVVDGAVRQIARAGRLYRRPHLKSLATPKADPFSTFIQEAQRTKNIANSVLSRLEHQSKALSAGGQCILRQSLADLFDGHAQQGERLLKMLSEATTEDVEWSSLAIATGAAYRELALLLGEVAGKDQLTSNDINATCQQSAKTEQLLARLEVDARSR